MPARSGCSTTSTESVTSPGETAPLEDGRRYAFKDWPLEDGLSAVEHMIKRWDRNGGGPLLRLHLWARDRLVSQTDRTYVEMKCLLTAIAYAGAYDQVNLARAWPALRCCAVVCRRSSRLTRAIPTSLESGAVCGTSWAWQARWM